MGNLRRRDIESDPGPSSFDRLSDALTDLAAGKLIVIADDVHRENTAVLAIPANAASPEAMAFMMRHTTGRICVPMPDEVLGRLGIPRISVDGFQDGVDARQGVITGLSAADRARTLRVLAGRETTADDLTHPGHIFPLRCHDGGVLRRPNYAEATMDVATMAGLTAAALAELLRGTLAEVRLFADRHGLTLISIGQVVEHRMRTERMVTRKAETRLPNRYGMWSMIGYQGIADETGHIALVYGDIGAGDDILVRVHSECLTGDALGSLRCDCGGQLDASMRVIATEGRGVVLYLRGHEGRGIGLMEKLAAYQIQDRGSDTVDANLQLGLPVDARGYAVAAYMLADLGIRSARMLTNNPAKLRDLNRNGIQIVGRLAVPVTVTEENLQYLLAKRNRMGHDLPWLSAFPETPAETEKERGNGTGIRNVTRPEAMLEIKPD